MEKYSVDSSESIPIVIDGKYVTRIKGKHIKAYGEIGAKNIINNALQMFQKSNKLLNDNTKSNNILIVGKVQSGKTSNLEMFTALAFDNGFNTVIIYGGYDTTLLKQTIERFKETFDVIDHYDADCPALFATDGEQIDDLDEVILDEIFDCNRPTIFVSMKRPQALNRINEMIKKINIDKVRAFIIDDEGDQASLNTLFNKNKKSPTYDSICKMKEYLNDPLYLSVTATPQANIFQYEMSKLCPSDVKLIAPGNGYTGADNFHLQEENIYLISKYDEDAQGYNESLKKAFRYYIISSAIMMKRGLNYSDMIIHTERSVTVHSELYTTLNSIVENMRDTVKTNDPDVKNYLSEIKTVYTTEFFNEEIINKYKFNDVTEEIKKVISTTFIVLQNSNGKETMSNANYKRHKIYIGGDLLQRGVTFKNLVTTYFTRWAKSGNMDTVLQRCRWFGYRGKYLDLCKIFTTKKIMMELASLAATENDLWNQFSSIETGDLMLKDVVIDAGQNTLNPTRKNIGKFKKVVFKNKWDNQRYGEFDIFKLKHNNTLFETILFDDSLPWTKTSKGRTDGKEWTRYTYINKQSIELLINDSYTIFESVPFDKKLLIKLIADLPIVVIDINETEVRSRSFYENKVSALQQGADKVDITERKYLGDSSVIIDENAVNIQIFKIQPKNYSEDYFQYMVSIHFPKTTIGFIKG